MKIETDHNCSDLSSIGLIELGTRDINVIFNEGSEMDVEGFDEFGAGDGDDEDWV